MIDVFISYKREQRARCERIDRKLRALGLSVWFDAKLESGETFDEQIDEAVNAAKAVLVLWSAEAIKSRWVRSEAAVGLDRGVLVAAQLADCKLPTHFRLTHFERLHDEAFADNDPAWLKLLERIGTLTGRQTLAGFSRVLGEAAARLSEWADQNAADPLAEAMRSRAARLDLADGSATTGRASVTSDRPWNRVVNSISSADYKDFLELYSSSDHILDARRHLRQLEAWGAVDQADLAAVNAFLETSPFPALGAAARAVAERLTREGEAAAAAERDRRQALERRLGPAAAGAFLAVLAGAPVARRAFRIDLPNVANWPGPSMVAIPPGRFEMGSPASEVGRGDDEGPVHTVSIGHVFALGRYPVTFAEWDAARAVEAKLPAPGDQGWGRTTRPVINVSFEDVQAYLAWLNGRLDLADPTYAYRLPSEAEWEYACRAGTKTPFSFGGTITTEQANFGGNLKQTTPVGRYPASVFGLHEMHGNVWEWCEDVWHDTYADAPTDGSAWVTGDPSRRVVRGGSWYGSPVNLRSARRSRDTPTDRDNDLGFRLARTLSPPAS